MRINGFRTGTYNECRALIVQGWDDESIARKMGIMLSCIADLRARMKEDKSLTEGFTATDFVNPEQPSVTDLQRELDDMKAKMAALLEQMPTDSQPDAKPKPKPKAKPKAEAADPEAGAASFT